VTDAITFPSSDGRACALLLCSTFGPSLVSFVCMCLCAWKDLRPWIGCCIMRVAFQQMCNRVDWSVSLAQISSLWTREQDFHLMLATRSHPIMIPYQFLDYAASLEFTLMERRCNFLSSSVSQASGYVPVCNGPASGRVDFERGLIYQNKRKSCRTREQLHLIGSCCCTSLLSHFASFTCSPCVDHFT